ncbi:ABC transporter ATP-binding protein [Calderihabitans maritimus]|uniref:Nickel import system ATP-binding protein NikD n=1 Tax=Calderihabitans maritimus TaxID=1246530 RepID=A0A1Z5HSJ9_9FIRM|nr:ABC transporter ATP-binding protein [Calderihabitans maritimus]GAW92503.1 glutathione ABC transporter ATP-binding protein GsiA [Calderihabitans maritimus]
MLEIRNLRVRYSGVDVLRGINLQVETGEILGIIGESGAGKTTLALTLMGLCQGQVEGKILFHGKDLLSFTEDNWRKLRWNEIAMVFQDTGRALNPVMTVFEQIMEPMLEHKLYRLEEAEKRVYKLLADVGLPEQSACAYPHQLSGGEKQRVLLAMALANQPRVLILDEPTSALDAITKAETLKLLDQISKGLTVILVTHDFSVAAKLSDRIAVLYAGTLLELGPAEKILERPRHPYTRGLLRSFPNMSTTKDLQGIPGTKEDVLQGCPFSPRCTQKIDVCEKSLPKLEHLGDREIACHRGGIVPLLQIKKLAKNYGSVSALKGVTLNLDEGETLALVGESGSGKSTLAKCIMGLEAADFGEILFQGTKLLRRDKSFYQSVQMIFQNPQECISHRLNVLEAVMEPLNIQGIGRLQERVDMVKKTLREVELPATDAFLSKYAHHLSGGELQRVAIARALILNPKLLIADEPTSALDASVQAKIIKLLLNLQEQRGLAMIFITHDLALARKISDRVAVMLSGSIVEAGPTSEVFALPRHPYTKDLLQAAPDFSMEIRDFNFARNNCQGACVYTSRCKDVNPVCLSKAPEPCEQGLRMVKCHLYCQEHYAIREAFG